MLSTSGPPFAIHHVELPDGGRLAWVEAGRGSPVLLLHGGVLDHRMWSPQLARWSQRHRVIAIDARGHGWSSSPGRPFRHCDELAAVITTLELAPATLVGISMGAGTAVDTALEHPELVDRIVVSGAGTSEAEFTDPWTVAAVERWHAAAARGDKTGWLEAFLDLAPGPRRTRADLEPEIVSALRMMAEHTLERHVPDDRPPLLPTPVTDTWARVSELVAPVLAVPGMADSSDHIGMCERLARLVPHGRIVEVPGAAHYPNLEQPDAWDDAVLPFLDGRP